MAGVDNGELDYGNPISIAKGVYRVGFYDTPSGLHCNPYLVVDGDESVVIDGGSRPDFPTVMMKILQTGVDVSSIKALSYQHYDPDLCGSISNFEDIINNPVLKIISHKENNMFIRHYSVSSRLISHESIDHQYIFSSGRTLKFIDTPYAHSAGSFVTADEKSGILFTSDVFGSYGAKWDLFLSLEPECRECKVHSTCSMGKSYCPILDIQRFHRTIMTSKKALKYAMGNIVKIPATIIAPQHGSVITDKKDIKFISEILMNLERVGIDAVLEEEQDLY